MKYIIASMLVFALCTAAGIAVTRRMSAKKELKLSQRIMITTAVSTVLIAVAVFAYLEVYYHADGRAAKYLKSGRGVEVTEQRGMYFFLTRAFTSDGSPLMPMRLSFLRFPSLRKRW